MKFAEKHIKNIKIDSNNPIVTNLEYIFVSTFSTLFLDLNIINISKDTKIEHIGKIEINAPIKSGMIRFGKRVFFRHTPTTIINNGTMEFKGNCTILGGSNIYIIKNKKKKHINN